MFCSNCGQQIPEGARFCPNCGQEVAVVTPVSQVIDTAADYSLVLLGCGTCNTATARDLISDLLGYTDAQAAELIRSVPVEIACSLNAQQVMVLSQALTEYGLQVSIRNAKGYVDFNASATSSVFNENGSILQNVMDVLGTLTLANRVRKIARWTIDDPFRFIFAPRYRRPAPPRYARHFRRPTVVRRTPKPAPRLLLRPVIAPKPKLRPAPRAVKAPRILAGSVLRPAAAPRIAAKPAVRPMTVPRLAVKPVVRPAVAPRPAAGSAVRPAATPRIAAAPRPAAAPRSATAPRLAVKPRTAAPSRPSTGSRPAGGLFGKSPNRPGSGRGGRGPGRP